MYVHTLLVACCYVTSKHPPDYSIIPHVLILLVKVHLIVFLHYGMDVDVSFPLSQLVAIGKNNIHY